MKICTTKLKEDYASLSLALVSMLDLKLFTVGVL